MQIVISDRSASRAHSWVSYRRWYACLPIPPLARVALAVLWDTALERPSDLAKVSHLNPPIVEVPQRIIAGWLGSSVRSARRALGELEKAGLIAVNRDRDPNRYTLAVPVMQFAAVMTLAKEDKMRVETEDILSSQTEDKMSPDKEYMLEGSERSSAAPQEREISPLAADGLSPGERVPSPKQRSLAFGLARRICREYEAEQIGLEVPFVASVFSRFLAMGHHMDDISSKALRACSITYASRRDGLAIDVKKYWASVAEQELSDGLKFSDRTKKSLSRTARVAVQVGSSLRRGLQS